MDLNFNNLLVLSDGTNLNDLRPGDMLEHVKTGDLTFVEGVFDDCINTVGGSIPLAWISNWSFVKHDAL